MFDGITEIEERLITELVTRGVDKEMIALLITNLSQMELAAFTMLVQQGKVDTNDELDILIKAGLFEAEAEDDRRT